MSSQKRFANRWVKLMQFVSSFFEYFEGRIYVAGNGEQSRKIIRDKISVV